MWLFIGVLLPEGRAFPKLPARMIWRWTEKRWTKKQSSGCLFSKANGSNVFLRARRGTQVSVLSDRNYRGGVPVAPEKRNAVFDRDLLCIVGGLLNHQHCASRDGLQYSGIFLLRSYCSDDFLCPV